LVVPLQATADAVTSSDVSASDLLLNSSSFLRAFVPSWFTFEDQPRRHEGTKEEEVDEGG